MDNNYPKSSSLDNADGSQMLLKIENLLEKISKKVDF